MDIFEGASPSGLSSPGTKVDGASSWGKKAWDCGPVTVALSSESGPRSHTTLALLFCLSVAAARKSGAIWGSFQGCL